MTEYRIEFSIQRRDDGADDFAEIGFGSSGATGSPDQAAYEVESAVQNGIWETAPDAPTEETDQIDYRKIAGVNGALYRSAEGDVSAVHAELAAIDAETEEFTSRHNPECECEVIQSTREVVRRIKAALSAPHGPADARTPVTAATEAHGGAGEAQEG